MPGGILVYTTYLMSITRVLQIFDMGILCLSDFCSIVIDL